MTPEEKRLNHNNAQRLYRLRNPELIKHRTKDWKERHKEQVRQGFEQYWKKFRDLVYDHYGRICQCCGETEQSFLSLDHINNDGASQRRKLFGGNKRSINGSTLYYRLVKVGYPTDIQTLCMNCQWGKLRNKGVCPHANY